LLPLLVLSPLTGLFLVWGVSFTGSPPPAARTTALSMVDVVRKVGAEHDLSGLVWLRGRAGRQLARVVVDGEYRVFTVSADGVATTTRNWVRIWHEGNFAGVWSALMNVVISFALVGLMVTGLIIWARRRFRKRRPRPARTGAAVGTPA
ncbi:MAG: PepSY domain-containing protein, partial [Phreatobacter sp.]|nr:PepSY domain-containing protein [Phreatobacter sp.]